MLKKLRRKGAATRLSEELLFEQAMKELDEGLVRPGIWGKALVSSDGDEQRAKALYLKYRVQAMLDEGELVLEAAEEVLEKQRAPETLSRPKVEDAKSEKKYTSEAASLESAKQEVYRSLNPRSRSKWHQWLRPQLPDPLCTRNSNGPSRAACLPI